MLNFIKRICCVFLVLALIFTVSCQKGKEQKKGKDLFAVALEESGYDKLTDMPVSSVGEGVFSDYFSIHQNPTSAAKYPSEYMSLAGKIESDTTGFDIFFKEILTNYGFEKDFFKELKTEYEKDIDLSLTELFNVCEIKDGLEEAIEDSKKINKKIRPYIAQFLSAIAEAYSLFYESTSIISNSNVERFQSFIYCKPATNDPSALGSVYWTHEDTDEEKLLTACMAVTKASIELCKQVKWNSNLTRKNEILTINTPIGDIVLGTSGDDKYSSNKTLLLIDPNGDDVYEGEIAYGSGTENPFSVVIDVKGNDKYIADSTAQGTQGCGVVGAGLLFDLSGDDKYTAYNKAQGFGLLGTGILFDGDGDDIYKAQISAQAAANFGIGCLADIKGDDIYNATAYAQASAGSRAMAFMIDKQGNDQYAVTVPVQEGYEDLSYELITNINANWSQGCGWGQRNIENGFRGISGGIAGIIDISGNDVYDGAVFVQGVGYWSGIGFISDKAGDDLYSSKYYSQALGCHYGVGILIDEVGCDKHTQYEGSIYGQGASMGFVWDRGVAMFVDGSGNDTYLSHASSFGVAWSAYDEKGPEKQDLTYAFFIEMGGDDTYSDTGKPCFGYGLGGYFIDLSGDDTYRDLIYGFGKENNTINKNEGGIFMDYKTPSNGNQNYISFYG